MIAAALLAAAVPMARLQPGIWSSVRYSRESGDADGLEVIVPAGSVPTIGLMICEGGCTSRVTLPIRRTSVGFAFDYAEGATDQAGRPSLRPTRHAEARFDGDVLVVVWLHEDNVDILRRRSRALAWPRETPVLVK